MFTIAFDIEIAELKKNYGEPHIYNNAYLEIGKELRKTGFKWTQKSLYVSKTNNIAEIYKAINNLSKIDWFKKSVRDIRAFRVEN